MRKLVPLLFLEAIALVALMPIFSIAYADDRLASPLCSQRTLRTQKREIAAEGQNSLRMIFHQ